MEQNILIYRTKDLALAGYLLTLEYKLTKADRNNPKGVVFQFEYVDGKPALETVIAAFQVGVGLIEPRAYYRNIKMLKTVIYGGYRETEDGTAGNID